MKRIFIVLLFLIGTVQNSSAMHIFGGELLYTYQSGNSYIVTLTLYGDCSSASMSNLPSAAPTITLYDGSSSHSSINLTRINDTNTNEVSPVCQNQLNNTTCKGGTLPGVKKFVYQGTMSVPYVSTDWRFVFDGDPFAGRSNNITNVDKVGSTLVYLVAALNNSIGPNSSPQYTTIPTPYYCVHVPAQNNQGAIDPDGDSLFFRLSPGLVIGGNVTYIYPTSATHPLLTDSGAFYFDSVTGQMNFTASLIQDGLVVNQVFEYKNGVLVGSSMREMTFIIQSNCSGLPPTGNIVSQSISGGVLTNATTINVCTGTPTVSFTIDCKPLSGDTVTVNVNNNITNANITVNNNSSGNPQLVFNWNSSSAAFGAYYFYITLKDNHCPVSNTQTIAYTINVINPFSVIAKVISPTQCVHDAVVEYVLTDGLMPAIITAIENNDTIKAFATSSRQVTNSLPAGTYIISASSAELGCLGANTLIVKDSGRLPVPFNESVAYCKGEQAGVLSPLHITGASETWYDGGFHSIASAPTPSTLVPGTYTWFYFQQFKVCNAMDTLQVTVNDLPHVSFTNVPSVCFGDTVHLEASGGVDFKWFPEDSVFKDNAGKFLTRILNPGTYTVHVTTQYGCQDSAGITFSKIEQCCLFSYPNAFTPNDDGHNDKFHPVIYGHTETYQLDIYDRWGEMIFHTFNPYVYWDGTYKGEPCETGTYFFRLSSTCLTGKKEEYKGDVILIR